MDNFIISTDSTADLPAAFIEEHGLVVHPLYYYVDGVQYGQAHELSSADFYDAMRNDASVSTSASNPDVISTIFTAQAKEGLNVLHLSFSSGLSCSYNNASVTAREVMAQYPGVRIKVIDTLCASLGQGLLVYYALKLKDEGKSMDEIIDWVMSYRLRICHEFTVDDLKYLHRGGRVSKAACVIGTLINIKPVLHVDNEGHLVPLQNVRGRKKSLSALLDNMESHLGSFKNEIFFVCHGDCPEEAEEFARRAKERFGIDSFLVNGITPTVGSHSGPGTLGIFYVGDER